MLEKKTSASVTIVALALLLIPAVASAQSGIAGVVKDTTGAVLPGVTAEASSPALIEKVRTVVTDDQGQYKIVDLRPGVYAVTFTLAGFSTVKREGIELSASFTATVNADMRVGAVAETVTVSGRSPLVDVHNVVQQRTVTRELIDAVPGGKGFMNLAPLIPGIVVAAVVRQSAQDVGGAGGEVHRLAIHGGRPNDMALNIDGLPYNNMVGTYTGGFRLNPGEIQESSFELGAISAESASGGVRLNIIPKEGGNTFAGSFFGSYTNHSLVGDNLSNDLKARGLSSVNEPNRLWDANASVGGPIKREKLWFFSSFRHWGADERVAGMFYDKDPLDFVYTPDLSRQATDGVSNRSEGVRFTWQVTPKNKLSLYPLHQDRSQYRRLVSGTVAPEAAGLQRYPLDELLQAAWSSPLTNRLLLEVGTLISRFGFTIKPQPGITPETYSVLEQSTNLQFRAAPGYSMNYSLVESYRAALSYVTGSHALKVGLTLQQGTARATQEVNGDINLQLLNGVPRSVTVNATPRNTRSNLNAALGLFAQDQWTTKRLTLNAGIRFDYLNESVPEQHLPAVRFVGARDFAAVHDVPNWTDLSPRLGAAYDLFGTGTTALKVSLSRYVTSETSTFANANNPINTSVNTATRTWNDLNGDFIPQANELGPLSDANFGQVRITTRYDDAVRQGFGSRGYNWETSASLQHELLPRVSVNAAYFRRWYGNFTVTDNLLVTPADYNPFCITAPVDARLPGGGGNQICGLYDITPPKFGQFNSLVTFAKNFGKQYENWNGVDLTMDARLPHGARLSGGVSIGRTAVDNCDVAGKVDNPATVISASGNTLDVATTVPAFASPSPLYCHQETPFQPQVKFLGTFNLPWDLHVSGTFQSLAGPEITASYVATNEEIRGSLGRDLAAGARGTVTVPLISPATMYAERLYQVDGRLARLFTVGRTRIQGNFDLYNLLNASAVLRLNTRYGPAWQQPTYILTGRMFKFGVQVDF